MVGKSLYEIYKKPSHDKVQAYEKIYREYLYNNGYNMEVRGSSFSFSVCYYYDDVQRYTHFVKHTKDNVIDKKLYRPKNIIASYSLSAFNAYVILDIIDDEQLYSAYYYDGKLSSIRKTKVHCTSAGRAYIVRDKQRLYLDSFLKIWYNSWVVNSIFFWQVSKSIKHREE